MWVSIVKKKAIIKLLMCLEMCVVMIMYPPALLTTLRLRPIPHHLSNGVVSRGEESSGKLAPSTRGDL